jgi:CRISPR-associated endonuclease/helicase Cas3
MTHQPISIELESRSIPQCQKLLPELKFMRQALQHQVDVFEATKEHDIVLDLAPTGTGKTKAGLTALLHQADRHAVYIAPTNALIEQQKIAAEEFIRSTNGKLNHVVKAVTAREVRSWSNDRVGNRPGEKLYNLLRNPATVFPEVGANRPILLVMNPDIFYYGTFFSYNQKDKVNLATSFYTQFSTIIFDEFHLYDAKQLVSLLFYLSYLHIFGFFQAGRRVVLLTATPEPACESALAVLESKGVRIKQIDGEIGDDRIPSQTSVNLELRVQRERDPFLEEIADRVITYLTDSPAEYGAVILDSKDHINRLATLLEQRGYEGRFGRIHGSTPQPERIKNAQKQVILATSTVDIGFNFDRDFPTPRQNLDWLIFSARDRSAFWQRIGRVGRILGKTQTDLPSTAIGYFQEYIWDEGLRDLDTSGGRNALSKKLTELKSLDRPFLEVYWQSEALLETTRPLLMLEGMMDKLPEAEYIPRLFETIKTTLGGRRDWKHYQSRMKALEAAKFIVTASDKDLAGDPLKWVKGNSKWAIVTAFLRSEHPDEWDALKNKQSSIRDYEKLLKEDLEVAESFKQFAKVFNASYTPLFQFRSSLFENLHIRDPKGLLLDLSDETELDPIHLLRNYEFVSSNGIIEVTTRAKDTYELNFKFNYDGDWEQFKNKQINKLSAFENCRIERRIKGAISPTPLLSELEKKFLPGVIVSTIANQGIIIRLRKQGIASYPICVNCSDIKKDNYTIFPGFAGILAAAMNIKIRLMDEEDFWIAG